jgi:hypothetical protein
MENVYPKLIWGWTIFLFDRTNVLILLKILQFMLFSGMQDYSNVLMSRDPLRLIHIYGEDEMWYLNINEPLWLSVITDFNKWMIIAMSSCQGIPLSLYISMENMKCDTLCTVKSAQVIPFRPRLFKWRNIVLSSTHQHSNDSNNSTMRVYSKIKYFLNLNEYYLPIFILSIHFRQISFF